MKTLLNSIAQKHQSSGIEIRPPVTSSDIAEFEHKVGFYLPPDFREFYRICNGFFCNEDLFNMVSLADIPQHTQDHGDHWFYFSEYMIYSDMWGLRLTPGGQYEIFNGSYPDISMTSSLAVFLERFLKGNVFDPGGIYEWQEELKLK
jgi:hypothetical protein